MIINLTKKTILSRKPNFRLSAILRAGIIHKEVFKNSDCIVFQNCKMALNLSRLSNIEVVFTDAANRIYKIASYTKPKIFLRSAKSFTILILPEGMLEKSSTTIDDILDLSADVTTNTKRSLMLNSAEVSLGIPNTAIEGARER